jgi:hypothetical protein
MSVIRLNEPVPAQVWLEDGQPVHVRWQGAGVTGGKPGAPREAGVERVLDTWYVDDAWWTDAPVRRVYHECQLDGGMRRVLVFDLVAGAWRIQRCPRPCQVIA